MRFPRLHRFLRWAGPTFVVACAGILGLIAAFSQSHRRLAEWSDREFDYWWPVVTAPLFLGCVGIVIFAYIAALVYTGMPRPVRYKLGDKNLKGLARVMNAGRTFQDRPQHPSVRRWLPPSNDGQERSGSPFQPTVGELKDARRQAALQRVQAPFDDEWNYITKKERGEHVRRDKPLSEALAYAARGRWDGSYFDVVAAGEDGEGKQLGRFHQAAYDGKVRVWGKRRPSSDLHEEIPREHWSEYRVEWFDLLRGKPRTEPRGHNGDAPFFDLMVSRAEIEEALPYEK